MKKPGNRFQEADFKSEAELLYMDRCKFLEIVLREYPVFWNTLREWVLPNMPANVSARSIRSGYKDPALASIAPSFSDWINRFHVENAYWLHEIALRTLRMWKLHPNARKFDAGIVVEFRKPVTIEWDGLETEAQFRTRLTALQATYKRTRRPLNEDYAKWFILYQFEGLSPGKIRSRISRTFSGDETSSIIRKGYGSVADRLGIPLRSARRGPKRK